MEKTIFLCEDCTDGIFTGVYEAWASRLGHDNVTLKVGGNHSMELFARYVEVKTDPVKACKVANALRNRLGEEEYTSLYQASLSKENDKADPIYRVAVLALLGSRRGSVMERLSEPNVCRVFELSRNAGHEAHRYFGFVRFRELSNGVLYAIFEPENRVLTLMGDHFADRLTNENFVLYDKTHGEFIVHEAGKPWGLVSGEAALFEKLEFSDREEEFQSLWKGFCRSVAIKERINPGLMKQMMPLKCRTYMPEVR